MVGGVFFANPGNILFIYLTYNLACHPRDNTNGVIM